MMRVLCGLLMLALAGCADMAPPRACSVEAVASLPIEPGSHLVVPGRLNQGEVRFALDTGAEGSFVTPEAAQRNTLARSRSTTRIIGIGGVLVAENVFANVELGGLEVRRQVAVAPLPIRNPAGPVSGLLGSEMLSQYDVEVSVPERRVRLWRVAGCSGDYVRWAGRHWSIPLRRTTADRLLLDVTLDRAPLRAILDTGADSTLLGASAARQAGAAGLDRDPIRSGIGADGNMTQRRRHRFASLTIGPETFHDPSISVAENDFPQTDMLLGMDWMQTRRVWISWESRQVFVQPAQAIPAE